MPSRATTLVLVVFLSVLLAGDHSLGHDGEEGMDGDRGGRDTPIDGKHRDDFSTAGNLTLYGDAGVLEGTLTVERAVLRDAFSRTALDPWVAVEGSPYLFNNTLVTAGNETANSTAGYGIDLEEVEVETDLVVTRMVQDGPIIELTGSGMGTLVLKYSNSTKSLVVGNVSDGLFNPIATTSAHLDLDVPYSMYALVRGGHLELTLGSASIDVPDLQYNGSFDGIRLKSPPNVEVAWSNVTILKMGGSGHALTDAIALPMDTLWSELSLTYITSASVTMEISLLDAKTDQPVPGFESITKRYIDISDLIDPVAHGRVQLKVVMEANGTEAPYLQSWELRWVGDPPRFVKRIPDITLDEDVPGDDVLDLRSHFEDRLTDDDNLTFTVSHVSEAGHVRPVVDGHMLDVELPLPHWHGEESFRVECSDGTLSVESVLSKVTVLPVDDPPIVRPIPRVLMDEDTTEIVDVSRHLEDVDTPVGSLVLRVRSDHANVVGQTVHLHYDRGGVVDRIELLVSDESNDVSAFFEVVVAEVDDPPLLSPLAPVTMREDDPRVVDLTGSIHDEDTDPANISVAIPDNDGHITIEGLVLTLLYNDTGGDFVYTVQVSDGTTSVSGALEVRVEEVNDPPVITAVGDHAPVGDELDLQLVEGESAGLLVSVTDEEGEQVSFQLVSAFEGASMDGATLNLVSSVGQIGTYRVQVSASDGGTADLVVINLEVTNRNDPPQDVAITAPQDNSSFENGTVVSFSAYALDPDKPYGDEVAFHWSSDLDGDLGSGKTLVVPDLSVGVHNVTLEATDGEASVEVTIRVTIEGPPDGNGDGPGTDGGGDGGGGASTGLLAALVLVVLIVAVALLLFIRGRGAPPAEEDAAPKEPPRTGPTPSGPTADTARTGGPHPSEEGDETPVEEGPGALAGDVAPETPGGAAPGDEPDRGETALPAEEVTMTYEAVAVDTTSLTEVDPEAKRMDDLKREYQAAISSLPYGVPAKELQGMDWHELAAALATGERKQLEDGRTVTRVGEHWFFSDREDTANFLRRHE